MASQQLSLVLELQEKEEEKKLKHIGFCDQQLQQLESQLKALEDYAMSYQQQLSSPGTIGIQQRQLIVSYLTQVQSAIVGQVDKVQHAKQRLDQARTDWLAVRVKMQGLEKLIEKRQEADKRASEAREQKELDALSQVGFFYKNK